MSRRRMMYSAKELIEVVEKFTTAGTFNWVVPSGCKEVEAFIVAGGQIGGEIYGTVPPNRFSGKGGNGGQCILKTITVFPKESIPYTVGGNSSNSSFGDIIAISGLGALGGASLQTSTQSNGENGNNGEDGVLYHGKYYGAGGGGGCFDNTGSIGFKGGIGGRDGGGNGGWTSSNGKYYGGYAGSFYGAGGGGSGRLGQNGSNGGNGYQGIIILRYKKFK